MTKLIVDGKEIDVPPEYTLLQACEAAGAEIPRFCFHERLSIAGNCRMCLIEVVGIPKPQASCAMGVKDLMPNKDGSPKVLEHALADGAQGARRRDGILADQSSARLPDLRPGRRMRSAGPVDGLRHRFQPLPREQARGRGQISRRAGQDLDEPLHPVHALCALCHRSGGRARARRHRPRRGHGDHHLSRTGDDVGIAGQRGRYLSGRRADVEALCVRGAALGAQQDGIDRRHGRARLRHPHRHPRPRGDADFAAHQRGHQRGVDFRQDAPRGRWLAHAAARSALCARERQAAPGDLERGVQGDRRQSRARQSQAHGRAGRRSRRGRGDFCAQGFDDAARREQSRLPAGRLGARSQMGQGELSVQSDHRRHRGGRCAAHRRLEPAQGSTHPQCAHPQALARRQFPDRRHRAEGGSDLRLRLSRRRPGNARRYFAAQLCRARCARPSGRWCWSARRRSRAPTARRWRRWRQRPPSISAP